MKVIFIEIYVVLNKEFMKMEGMGMIFMFSYYDGMKGVNIFM